MSTNTKTGLHVGIIAVVLTGAFGAEIVDRKTDKITPPIGASRTPVPEPLAAASHISLTPVVAPIPPDPYPLQPPPVPVPETKPEAVAPPLPPGKPSVPHARAHRRIN